MDNNIAQIITNIDYGDKFGYSEMFEWGEVVDSNVSKISKFVQFSEKHPHTVILARDTSNIVGVSTMIAAYVASNPTQWPYKYVFNEYGDLYLEEKNIGIGEKAYDSVNEINYMQTHQQKVFMPIVNPNYDSNKQYIPRTSRNEWTRVTILGKAIVEDNGKCEPGKYCTVYTGDDKTLYGSAMPCSKKTNIKFYVLERLSEHTILIFITSKI